MMSFERVGSMRCAVGESPLWSARDAAWYWVDITGRHVWRIDPATGDTRSWWCAQMVACIAERALGGFVAGMETGLFGLQLEEGGSVNATLLASPPALQPGMRFNDGRCDRQGRFWSGTMWMDGAAARDIGSLYRYDGDGLAGPFVEQLFTQNGLAWSPDGRTMYLSDSHPHSQQVWAFDYDTVTGVPSKRRLFIDMRSFPGRPDGAAVDSEGCYWTCANDAGLLLRFTPQGQLDRQIELPMAKPAMCSFGGPGLDTLMVTSIGAGQPEADEWAGATLLLRPGVQGVAETPFI